MEKASGRRAGDDVAVVTGAGRGIGRAIAVDLAARGRRVALVARSVSELDSVASEIGDSAVAFPLDVRRAGDVAGVFSEIRREFGPVGVLVNAAGVYHFGFAVDADEADFDSVVDTNLKGTFLTCRAVLPDMLSRGGGDIVNIASIAGKVASASRSLYCASKFGVVGFSQSLAEEVREHGIRVTVVCPGSTNTRFSPRETEGRDRTRMLQPEDVAHTVHMVLSQAPTSFMSEIIMRPTRKP